MLFELVEYCIHSALHSPVISRVFAAHKNHHKNHASEVEHNYGGTALLKAALQQGASIALIPLTFYSDKGFLLRYVSGSILVYNTVHLLSHTNAWETLHSYHRAHHRNSSKNLGVSSPLCDWAFGTMSPKFTIIHPLFLILPPPIPFFFVTEIKK